MNSTTNIFNKNTNSNIEQNNKASRKRLNSIWKHIKKDKQLLIMFIPCLVFYIVFRYGPMYGIIIAFKKYNVYQGIIKSPWVGFRYFEQFFHGKDFFYLRTQFCLTLSLFMDFPMSNNFCYSFK